MKTFLASLSLGLGLIVAPAAGWAQTPTPGASTASACEAAGTDRVACLQDERAAKREQRRGGLTTPSAEAMARNLRARCEPLPDEDRQACLRRMSGEGTQRGSVEQGGVLRELVIVEKAPAEGATPSPAPR